MPSFEEYGGFEILKIVSKVFYDKIYKDPWIGKYFAQVSQEHIEKQQVDFMAEALGGPNAYYGAFVPEAHKHLMISEELFELREQYLFESFDECNASAALRERWLKIDRAFRHAVVKRSPEDCKKRFPTDEIIDFTHLSPKKKAA